MLKWPHAMIDAAVEDGAPLADQAIRHPAAGQRHHVHHRRVQPVDRAGGRGVEAEASGRERRGHEEDEQRAHPVIAEALPHLREEERREAARMAEKRAIVDGGRDCGNVRHCCGRLAHSPTAYTSTPCHNKRRGPFDLDVRHGPAAVRSRVSRRGAEIRRARRRVRRSRAAESRRARCLARRRGGVLPSDAHGHAARDPRDRSRARDEPVRPPRGLRAVRAAQRAPPARPRCRDDHRWGVRGGAGPCGRSCGARGRGVRQPAAVAGAPRHVPRARSFGSPSAGTLRDAPGRRGAACRGLHGGQPRLQAPLPALSDRARLRRPLPDRACRRSSSRTSPGRSRPVRSTSRSATRTSSTASVMRRQ